MELEALHAVVLDQPPRFARAGLAFRRIDAGERDHDVAVLVGKFGDLLVGIRLRPVARSLSTVKMTQAILRWR